jgi:hypothetical protein
MKTKQTIKNVQVTETGLEITVEVDNGFLAEEITWNYNLQNKGVDESLDVDSATNNRLGFLILALLRESGKFPKVCDKFEENLF